MSLWFYGFFNPSYLFIIITSILVNYEIYRLLKNNVRRKLFLVLGLIANIGSLFYFKYFDFFLENMNRLFQTDFPLRHILLPLGISFFTFQQISFIVDAYKGETPVYNLREYALFVTFFPQLIAGPIVTHNEILPQFAAPVNHRIHPDNLAKGLYVFTLGLAKKVLLADVFGQAVNWGYSYPSMLSSASAWLVILFYSIQLYFDFSGYCDMARGIGCLFNITLPVNFHSPYQAVDFIDFWKRWHITLSRFFTRYVYIPLGGSRKGKLRTYINFMAVFLLSGLWHGAGFTFLLWGTMHGIIYVLTKAFHPYIRRLPKLLTRTVTFLLVSLAWVYFRADTIAQANTLIGTALSIGQPFGAPGIAPELAVCFQTEELWYLLRLLKMDVLPYSQFYLMTGFTAVACYYMFAAANVQERAENFRPRLRTALLTAVLFVWSVVSFSGVSTFLYFNF